MRQNTIALLTAFAILSFTRTAEAQTITVKRGETAELGSVYWVKNCYSNLDDFEGITVKKAVPGLSLGLRKQDVKPTVQGCSNLVPGAQVIVTVGPDAPIGPATIEYKVSYLTKTGGKEQSNHTRSLLITQ